MILTKHNSTTIITQEKATLADLVILIEQRYAEYATDNIIVNLFSIKESVYTHIQDFLRVSKRHKADSKKSFVLVSESVSYEELPNELTVVPTLQEAHDIIEMEEIERDLGF